VPSNHLHIGVGILGETSIALTGGIVPGLGGRYTCGAVMCGVLIFGIVARGAVTVVVVGRTVVVVVGRRVVVVAIVLVDVLATVVVTGAAFFPPPLHAAASNSKNPNRTAPALRMRGG